MATTAVVRSARVETGTHFVRWSVVVDAIENRRVTGNVVVRRATRTCIAVAAVVGTCGGCAAPALLDAGDAQGDALATDGHFHDTPPAPDGLDGTAADASDDIPPGDVADGDGSAVRAIHGCVSFIDRSAPSAMRAIAFRNFLYDPNCIEIGAGQSVRFVGDFASHQLRPGIAISRAAIDAPGTMPNPIPATDTGAMLDVTFGSVGVFPYYCLDHEGTGMYGVVRVR